MTRPEAALLARFDWTGAACVGQVDDPDDERLRPICDRCPIVDGCLAYALVADEEHGIWGGMDRMEREDYRIELLRTLGEDDPVVRHLKGVVKRRGLELCPRCQTRWMRTPDRMCKVCEGHAKEVRDASKRQWFHGRDELPQVGATPAEFARAWLKRELAAGPQGSAQVKARADNAGITPALLRKARLDLDVHTEVETLPDGNGKRSTWTLPRHADRQTEQSTCIECSAPFVRDVVRKGRPAELCSDRCRDVRARRRQGPSLSELRARHEDHRPTPAHATTIEDTP